MQYPPQLMYNNINPKGFFSTFKQWSIQPLANGGTFYGTQDIRYTIQSVITGVMDPYRSHFQIQVQCDQITMPVGLLQLDSSAQSFIDQLVITTRNKQIQRIPDYSVLAAYLTDIGLSQMYAQGRQTQGLGYSNNDTMSTFTTAQMPGGTNTHGFNGAGNFFTSIGNFGTVNPTMSPVFNSVAMQTLNFQTGSYSQIAKTNNRHISPFNPAIYQTRNQNSAYLAAQGITGNQTTNITSSKIYGYSSNIRAQYKNAIHRSNYVDSTTSIPSYQIRVDKRTQQGLGANALWATGIQYKTYNPPQTTFLQNYTPTDRKTKYTPNITSLNGYSSLYSSNFSKGVNQPFISPTVPQCQMVNGKILPQKIPIAKKTFKIPLISAILGVLIPQDQFILIPIKALNQVVIQIFLDKYAMFTSGFHDVSQFDQNGMTVPQQRNFVVRRLNYHMHTYQFYAPQIDQYLNKSLMSRIVLNVNMWTLGNQYSIQKGQHVNNSWPVACTSQALNQIVVLFVSIDYKKHPFCRKHFRLSNNITKFQLRVNMDYYPSQPIIGNGGNPCLIDGLDNSNYLQNIYWSNNFMFNNLNPNPRINAYNFAINQRCYDVLNRNTFYDLAMRNDTDYLWKKDSINSDTAMGMPNIHQNRYVGKAAYVFSFQPYAHSPYHMTGIDCRAIRQFDVLMSAHPVDAFERQQTIYIYTRSSVIVQFTTNGINVYGK